MTALAVAGMVVAVLGRGEREWPQWLRGVGSYSVLVGPLLLCVGALALVSGRLHPLAIFFAGAVGLFLGTPMFIMAFFNE